MVCRQILVGWLIAVGACAPPLATARADSPSAELLRLVPDDVAFCLVIRDLRGNCAALLESPFVEKFRTSRLGMALRSAPELGKLAEVEKQVQNLLGIKWEELRDDVLGDAVVFAYRLGPPGRQEQEQGLLLVRARSEKTLARLVDRLNEVQKQSGDLKEVTERAHNGRKYYQRTERKESNFYFVRGAILCFATREDLLRRAIDLDQQRTPADKELPAVARALRRLNAEESFVALWINPRAFDSELLRKANTSKGAEADFLKAFGNYWKALDGIALHAVLGRDLELRLSIRVKPDVSPAAVRQLWAEAALPSDLWGSFGDDAMLAMAGRLDVPALVSFCSDFFSDDARAAIRAAVDKSVRAVVDKDLTTEVLPCLGPDWGFCVSAPPAADKDWCPHVLAALRVRPGKSESRVDQALLTAIHSLAVLIVLDHNSKHADRMSLKSTTHDKVEIKYLANDKAYPPGLQPAFALKGGYLVLASSPEAIRRFTPPTGRTPVSANGEVPILRISLRALRAYIKNRHDALAAYAANKNQISKEEAARRLEGLLMGLELFDRVELTRRVTTDQATLTLRIRPAEPLRK
ncbi:MAG TPA: hypothetical protein VKI65_07560 [Gemmataceae bacterium]|nr:hypothetical protein [Gemmataceae bacterium]